MNFTLDDLAIFIIAMINSKPEHNPIQIIGNHSLCLLQEQIGHNSMETQICAVDDFCAMIQKSFLSNIEGLNREKLGIIFMRFRNKLDQTERDLCDNLCSL